MAIPIQPNTGGRRQLVIELDGSTGELFKSDTGSPFVGTSARADSEPDGDVSQEDFGHFQACLSGFDVPYEPGCQNADLDGDDDVDTHDFALFLACHGGANIIANPACAN